MMAKRRKKKRAVGFKKGNKKKGLWGNQKKVNSNKHLSSLNTHAYRAVLIGSYRGKEKQLNNKKQMKTPRKKAKIRDVLVVAVLWWCVSWTRIV